MHLAQRSFFCCSGWKMDHLKSPKKLSYCRCQEKSASIAHAKHVWHFCFQTGHHKDLTAFHKPQVKIHDENNVSCPQSWPVLVALWQTMGRAINQCKHDCCRGNWLQQVAGIWLVYSCWAPIDTRLRRQLIVWSVYLVTYNLAQWHRPRKSPQKALIWVLLMHI